MQRKFAWQLLPAQQAAPGAPQVFKQVAGTPPPGLLQASPPVHCWPWQQAWFIPPHGKQSDWTPMPMLVQLRFWSQAELPAQHGCIGPPQVPHSSIIPWGRLMHLLGAVQRAAPMAPLQQGCPAAPQAWQLVAAPMPGLLQMWLGMQVLSGTQHG
jgi:hypothetical protein